MCSKRNLLAHVSAANSFTHMDITTSHGFSEWQAKMERMYNTYQVFYSFVRKTVQSKQRILKNPVEKIHIKLLLNILLSLPQGGYTDLLIEQIRNSQEEPSMDKTCQVHFFTHIQDI